jgi:hypothetical protein
MLTPDAGGAGTRRLNGRFWGISGNEADAVPSSHVTDPLDRPTQAGELLWNGRGTAPRELLADERLRVYAAAHGAGRNRQA